MGDASRAARLVVRVAPRREAGPWVRSGQVGWLVRGREGVQGPREVRAEEGGGGGVGDGVVTAYGRDDGPGSRHWSGR